ncbi:MAG TPA: RDD family protein [Steroidobacteraceae bacterium]|jgi:uncharacterized RDD family membrane protein YckC|nr:RDD family protein [Steroidobacteraceae bacterium]
MNTSLWQRLSFLAVLPLCTVLIMKAARATEPGATPDAPSAAAAAPGTEEASDWNDRIERRSRHYKHHHGNDVINIGRDSDLPSGQHADSVVSIFGSSTSEGQAGDVVSIVGDTRITGEVSDNAVSVLGDTYIDGKVDGDAVAVLGKMRLGPHGEIGGNVVAVGGSLERDPAAIIHGSISNVFAGNFGSAGWLRTWIHRCLLYGRPLAVGPGLGWAWGFAFFFLALYAALALLFRDGLTRCVQTFETQPGQTVLAALVAMLLTPVLVVLLFVTVIGIAAVPFIVFGLFCAGLFGKAVMLAWLGRRVTGRRGTDTASHPAADVLIGGALVLLLYLIPVLGFLVYKLLGFLGLGAVVYTVILAARAHRAAKQAPRSPSAAAATPAATTPGAATPAATTPDATTPDATTPDAPPPGASPAPREPLGAGAADPREGPGAAPAPPPVSAALPRAGFWIRMAALLIDALLVGFVMGIFHVYHLELVVLAAYGAVMWKMRGSTIGGIVFDLHVVRMDGRQVDWETAIVRALSCFLSLAVAGLGFIWIAFDDNHQAWHDKIAGTVVVRVAKGVPLV